MKKVLNIAVSMFTTVCVLSGNPHQEMIEQDPMLEKYDSLLFLSKDFPKNQQDSIIKFIQTDQITVMRISYYCKMNGN